MRALTWLAAGLLILVVMLTLSGFSDGWGGVLLIGQIPVVFASSAPMAMLTIGMAIVLMLFMTLFAHLSRARESPAHSSEHTWDTKAKEHTKRKVEGGAVIMIGPLPVVLGSDKRWTAALMVLALALMGMWLLIFVLL